MSEEKKSIRTLGLSIIHIGDTVAPSKLFKGQGEWLEPEHDSLSYYQDLQEIERIDENWRRVLAPNYETKRPILYRNAEYATQTHLEMAHRFFDTGQDEFAYQFCLASKSPFSTAREVKWCKAAASSSGKYKNGNVKWSRESHLKLNPDFDPKSGVPLSPEDYTEWKEGVLMKKYNKYTGDPHSRRVLLATNQALLISGTKNKLVIETELMNVREQLRLEEEEP